MPVGHHFRVGALYACAPSDLVDLNRGLIDQIRLSKQTVLHAAGENELREGLDLVNRHHKLVEPEYIPRSQDGCEACWHQPRGRAPRAQQRLLDESDQVDV